MDLVIFHYHLLPGGVTSVIRQCVEALRAHSRRVSRIRLVAGRVPEDMPRVARAEIDCLPEIDYASVRPSTQGLADLLLARFGRNDAVWWIHNYHLGKNPLLTEVVLRLAGLPDGPRLVLQPHDFPEAGRYANLAALERVVTLPLYPSGPRVRYALINRRDLGLLKGAGMPESRLFLLENPVGPSADQTEWGDDRRAIRSLLFPDANPLHQTLLYPVRSIRRKNVLEAAMLLHLVDLPLRLIITLPGVSRPERAYSALVERAFHTGIIPGELGTGIRRSDLNVGQLAAACDMVVSSSVQEGFGYLFVQALQWGLPLLARRLETIPGPRRLYEGYPASFYAGFSCPLDAPERAALLTRYRDKLHRIRRFLPAEAVERLENELSEALAGDAVDFSYLDPQLQMRLLAAAAEQSDFRSALRTMNGGLAKSLHAFLAERPPARTREVEQSFGLSAYASRVDQILESFDGPSEGASAAPPADIQERMRAAFARAQYARLLFD